MNVHAIEQWTGNAFVILADLPGLQTHRPWPAYPHGQGFMAATSIICAG
jgi:hypothetical protein